MPTPADPTDPGSCWDCGYSLRGLTPDIRRCPDCGRAFDHDDPGSVNRGKRVGRVARVALVPPRRLTLVLAGTGAAMAVWGTGGVTGFAAKFDDWPLLHQSFRSLEPWRACSNHWRVFVVGTGLLAGVAPLLLLRLAARGAMILRHHPPPDLRRGTARLGLIALVLAMTGVVFVLFGGAQRVGREWAHAMLRVSDAGTRRSPPGSVAAFIGYPARREAVIRALLIGGDSPRHRRVGLAIRTSIRDDNERAPLKEAAARERDEELLALELRVLAMYRSPEDAAFLAPWLDDMRPTIRAAAADAVGLIHSAAFRPQSPGFFQLTDASIPGQPPIPLGRFIDRTAPSSIGWPQHANPGTPPLEMPALALPSEYRDRLTRMMLGDVTLEGREAAARALLMQPPKGYRLRFAEWGVWLNEDGELTTARNVEAEIPPFVHRTGNAVAQMGDYVQPIMIVTKPVIHLTVSDPMSVDVEVLIHHGRPWFAYPMPDDFEVSVQSRQMPMGRPPSYPQMPKPAPFLAKLDPPAGSASLPLQTLRSGYPWTEPAHRRSGQTGGIGAPFNDITSWGVHWQSAIVTPTKQTLMKEPPVGDDPKHAWWRRLRDVECSWVSSRGESERFLYYDGPTLMKLPFVMYLRDGVLHTRAVAPAVDSAARREQLEMPRVDDWWALAVRVGATSGDVESAVVRPGFKVRPFDRNDHAVATGAEAAEAALRDALDAAGLTASESAGLLDTWRDAFFRTPGTRVLLIMPQRAYDQFCPMVVRPAPTERMRVGIVVTELTEKAR